MVAAGMPTKRRIPSFHAVPEGNKKAPSPGVLRLGDLGAQDDGRGGSPKRLVSSPISSNLCPGAETKNRGRRAPNTPADREVRSAGAPPHTTSRAD
jgi:hypothetical protein